MSFESFAKRENEMNPIRVLPVPRKWVSAIDLAAKRNARALFWARCDLVLGAILGLVGLAASAYMTQVPGSGFIGAVFLTVAGLGSLLGLCHAVLSLAFLE